MPKRGTQDAWTEAWSTHYEADEKPAQRRFRPRIKLRGGSHVGRYGVIGALLVAAVASPFAVAATSGSRVTNSDPRYSFIARNTLAGDGGAAALACQSDVGTGKEPCLNMVNKGTGLAGAFRTRGNTGFRLQTSGSGTATPFVLDPNATALVKYLNADQVDGKSADEIGRERFVKVAADGTVATGQSNGLATTTPVTHSVTVAGTYVVTFADDVSKCSYQVTTGDTDNLRVGSAAAVTGQATEVRVVIRDPAAATPATQPTDAPFSLSVNC